MCGCSSPKNVDLCVCGSVCVRVIAGSVMDVEEMCGGASHILAGAEAIHPTDDVLVEI